MAPSANCWVNPKCLIRTVASAKNSFLGEKTKRYKGFSVVENPSQLYTKRLDTVFCFQSHLRLHRAEHLGKGDLLGCGGKNFLRPRLAMPAVRQSILSYHSVLELGARVEI